MLQSHFIGCSPNNQKVFKKSEIENEFTIVVATVNWTDSVKKKCEKFDFQKSAAILCVI